MSDFVLEVLKIAEKTLGIYKLPLLVDAINDRGERRNHTLSGEREAEFGMRNSESGTARQYRIPSRAGKRRFPSMEDAHTEARYMWRSCRARFGLWRARPMK